MLLLRDIHQSFGDVQVLNGVSFHLEKGLVHTLKGGNGSGKTTLFNIISGFLTPTRGEVEVKGKAIRKFAAYRVNRLGVGRTFQDLRLAMGMTVFENILLALEKRMFARPGKAQLRRADEILEKVSLAGKRTELAGEISYGQQKLLTVGCCIANDAELLLIDEPVAGIDKDNQVKIIDLVRSLKKAGKTILQIEHSAAYIDAVSDRIFQMERGTVVCGIG